jgi:hypothetical protein
MTDVPFLSAMIVALLLLIRGIELNHRTEFVLGVLMAILSIFIRQTGVLILVGLVVAYPFWHRLGKRWLLAAVVPLLAAVFLLWSFERYLDVIGQTPGLFTGKSIALKQFVTDVAHGRLGAFKTTLQVAAQLLLYLGLCSLPLSLLIAPDVLSRLAPGRKAGFWLGVAVATAGVTALLVKRGWLMPVLTNQLNKHGLGITTLPGTAPELPRPFWIAVTALAVAGAIMLIVSLVGLVKTAWPGRGTDSTPAALHLRVVFLLMVVLLNFAPLLFSYMPIFDRYTLVFLPLLVALTVALLQGRGLAPGPLAGSLAAVVAAVYLVFGVAATHDYLDWNRSRWAAAATIHANWGAPEEEIDGGFEYNNLLDARKRLRAGWVHRPGIAEIIEETARPYRLAFSPLPASEVLTQVEVHPWLPTGIREIYCLRRLPPREQLDKQSLHR